MSNLIHSVTSSPIQIDVFVDKVFALRGYRTLASSYHRYLRVSCCTPLIRSTWLTCIFIGNFFKTEP